MTEPAENHRISWGMAAATGAILVIGYVIFEVVTAPEPGEPVREAAATGAAEAAQPLEEGFGLLTSSASDPAAVARAAELFREARRRDPESAGAWFGVGWASQLSGDAAAAERAYRIAIAVARGQAVASDIEYFSHFNLAWLYREQGALVAADLELAYAERLTADPAGAGVTAESTAADRALYDLGRVVLLSNPQTGSGAAFIAGLAGWRQGNRSAARAAFERALGPTESSVTGGGEGTGF